MLDQAIGEHMMTINATFKQIELFLAVAETLSFSKAAQICHISQPALSMNIRKLEDSIGARLFDRHTRNVSLTAVGREFHGMSLSLRDKMQQVHLNIREFVHAKKGKLIVAASPSIAASFAPQVIAQYLQSQPDIEIKFYDELADVCIDLLRKGKADVALIPTEGTSQELNQIDLFFDYFVVVIPEDHPLASKTEVEWSDLRDYPHIQIRSPSTLKKTVDGEMSAVLPDFRAAYEVGLAVTLLSMIRAGLGIGVLSHSSLGQANMTRLTFRRIAGHSTYRSISAVSMNDRSPPPLLDSFVQACRNVSRNTSEFQ
ncbi:LysR family transcriptional regulator [Variovorax sp. M-6]|uniref:LysR family transcriptional regulator n=1 Tax=Variovorax sp. M-6 TaxID=3233041 RepID=UPI003F967D18